jgi:hypothetical protein
MAEQNHYEILGVRPMADLEAIKRAYREKIRRYHPDGLAAERARLLAEHDQNGLRSMEKRLHEYQQKTQNINAAYAILSDATKRAEYDRRQRERTAPAPRRSTSVTTAPERTPSANYQRAPRPRASVGTPSTAAQKQSIPYALFGALGFVLIFVMSFVASFIGSNSGVPVAVGKTADELQMTVVVRQGTEIARTQAALLPSATPLSAENNTSAADNFFALGEYVLAIELYSRSISAQPRKAELYRKRGLAYYALRDSQAGASLYALSDLERYLELGGEQDTDIRAALSALRP